MLLRKLRHQRCQTLPAVEEALGKVEAEVEAADPLLLAHQPPCLQR